MRYFVAGALLLTGFGVAFSLWPLRKAPAPPVDWKSHWDARLAALRSVLGPADDRILTSPVPFYLGGDSDVLTFRHHAPGVCYVTAWLIGDDRVKPNRLGQYELMICLREPDDWAPSLVGRLARYTTEAVLQPGDTMDIAPALPQPTRLHHFLLATYAQVRVEGQAASILLCLGITDEENQFRREQGSEALLAKLKLAGVFPFTDLARPSVGCDP